MADSVGSTGGLDQLQALQNSAQQQAIALQIATTENQMKVQESEAYHKMAEAWANVRA